MWFLCWNLIADTVPPKEQQSKAEHIWKATHQSIATKRSLLVCSHFYFMGTKEDTEFCSSIKYIFSQYQVAVAGKSASTLVKINCCPKLAQYKWLRPFCSSTQWGQELDCATQCAVLPLPHFPLSFHWRQLVHLLQWLLDTFTGYLQPGSVTPAQGLVNSSGTAVEVFAYMVLCLPPEEPLNDTDDQQDNVQLMEISYCKWWKTKPMKQTL